MPAVRRPALQHIGPAFNGPKYVSKFYGKMLHLTVLRMFLILLSVSPQIQMRAFQLAADIAASSPDALSAVRSAGLLRPLVDDLSQSTDVLSSINALELLGEIAKSPHGASFVVEGQLPRQLEKLISGDTTDGFVRSRAMMVAARLVSPEGGRPSPLDEQGGSEMENLA